MSEIFHVISPGYLSVLISIRRLVHVSVGFAVGGEVIFGVDIGDEVGANAYIVGVMV